MFEASCLAHYQPPASNQPHALVSVRRMYYASPRFAGETRWERITLDDALWSNQVTAAWPDGASASEVRVRPGPLHVKVSVQFSHVEQRPVQQTVVLRDDAQTSSRTGAKHTEPRTIYAPLEVQDDRCDAEALSTIVAERAYVLLYEYAGYARCRVICLEQKSPDTEPQPCGS
jgi:hypothetical protein